MTFAWLTALAVPAVVTFVAIALLARSRWALSLADLPNERSLHEAPTPRVGGMAMLLGALPVALLLGGESIAVALACAAALAVISVIDDVHDLPIEVRLPAHLAAATITVLALGSQFAARGAFAPAEATVAVLAIAWMANLYNFMDGSDALAGSMTLVGFGTLSVAAAVAGHAPLALSCAAIASSACGFLPANFPPARVFMGDAGSVPLGFLAGALGLQGALDGAWPLWFPLLVFSPFIVDATVTILRRIARRERFWRAHREHAYQRLVLAGWTHRRLAWGAMALMAACAASAVAALAAGGSTRTGILIGWAAIYLLLLFSVERRRPLG